MWITLLLAIFLIATSFLVWQSKQTNDVLQARFDQVIGLRQLIYLLRFHRRQSHQCLSHIRSPKLEELNEAKAIKALLHTLVNQAEQTHKPMHRILRQRINSLLNEWFYYSVRRNQAVHGKAIRHVLYLIDDLITQSLLAAGKEQLFNQYQAVWPITLNAIDSLSRFRHTIESYNVDNSASKRELKLHIQIIQHRLGQLSLLMHRAPPAFMLDELQADFGQINLDAQDVMITKQALYQLSLRISDTIFILFDVMLGDIANDISVRFPTIHLNDAKIIPLDIKSDKRPAA
ncbi:hypothetical protein [Photobacterium lipolyticum]|uniref:Nitrate/nitrite sensing protein domain-containing protein n=1 Tax=Photobacterium lipolyticum TaxID=266810 RepID=A0A2T3MUM7_9GAMM|nr:hypothetical protein [Photobacterium lipolyticum]PSW03669.1 hypothetical protein C9I89_17290 [Photobacterium lipolyticum]